MTLSFQTPNIGSSLSEARRIKERDDKRVTRREERVEMVKVRRLLREQFEDGWGAPEEDEKWDKNDTTTLKQSE